MLRIHGGEAECLEILDGRLVVDFAPAVADVEDGNAAPCDFVQELHRARQCLGASLVHGSAPPKRIKPTAACSDARRHRACVVRDGLVAVEDNRERLAAAGCGMRLRTIDCHERRIVALIAERTILRRGTHPEECHVLSIGELLCADLLLGQRQRHRRVLHVLHIRTPARLRRGGSRIRRAPAEQERRTAESNRLFPLILPLDVPCVHREMLLFLYQNPTIIT